MTSTVATWNFYNTFKLYFGTVMNMATDAFKVLLTTSSYTPSASHSILTDITNELSGNGYARQPLSSVLFTQTSGTATFTSAPFLFTAAGGTLTARYFVIYNDTVSSPVKPLVAYGLLDNTPADVVATDGNSITYTPNASGLFTEA